MTLIVRYDVVSNSAAVVPSSFRRVAWPRRPGTRPSVARRRFTAGFTPATIVLTVCQLPGRGVLGLGGATEGAAREQEKAAEQQRQTHRDEPARVGAGE